MAGESIRAEVKALIKDTKTEPYARWIVKRLRGIRMPFALVKNEIYDRQALEVMTRVLSADSNCVDIGCHKGEWLRAFLKYAPRGHHIAFEPIPHLAQRLRDEFPPVKIFELALSDTFGEAAFYIIPGAPTLSGLHSRKFIRSTEPRQEIRVATSKLDSLIPADERVDFIKIDVEGAEGLVIAGALDTIRRNQPYIVLEHGVASSSAFGISSSFIYETLVERCGLQISLLADWLSGSQPLTKKEFVAEREWYFLAHPVR